MSNIFSSSYAPPEQSVFLSSCWSLTIKQMQMTEDLYFMLLVTLALKTLVSISRNGLSPITLNKPRDNNYNKHIINASTSLP
jgi:hypothetical protein